MTRHRRLVALLALTALAFVTVGCGLSEETGPQAIAPANLPPDLLNPNPGTSTTLSQSTATTSIRVYFIRTVGGRDRLSPVDREVASPTQPGDRISALLTQPTAAESRLGITSSIPANTTLIDVTVNDASRELVINLSSELFSIQGEELAKAFAQIVWTVSELDSIRQVRFLVNGVAFRAPNAEGVEQNGAVTRSDYTVLAPL